MGSLPAIVTGSTGNLVEPDVVARAARGDREAFRFIVEEHKEWLFRYHYRMMGNREEAEDLVQETFLRAWKGFDRFDPARPLRPWMLRIASNLAHSALRRPRRVTGGLDETEAREPVDPRTGEAAVEARNELAAIRTIVAALPPADRELFHLRYHEGLGPSEIAGIVEKSEGAVSVALHRMKEKIRTELDGKSGKEPGRHGKE